MYTKNSNEITILIHSKDLEIIFQSKSILEYFYDLLQETPYQKMTHNTDAVIVHISQSCVKEDNKNVTPDMQTKYISRYDQKFH